MKSTNIFNFIYHLSLMIICYFDFFLHLQIYTFFVFLSLTLMIISYQYNFLLLFFTSILRIVDALGLGNRPHELGFFLIPTGRQADRCVRTCAPRQTFLCVRGAPVTNGTFLENKEKRKHQEIDSLFFLGFFSLCFVEPLPFKSVRTLD